MIVFPSNLRAIILICMDASSDGYTYSATCHGNEAMYEVGGLFMTITLQRLGTELTRELTCIHKESIGKGPSNTSISIFENTILVKLQDVLSTFELSVSLITDGEEKIKQMRAQLFAEYSHELLKVIQKYANCTLQETVSTVDVRKKEVYLLMIFDRNLEECFRS